MLRFAAPRSRGRVIAWSLLLATTAALGLTRWIKASDHKDSALLAADPAADIADIYTFRSPVNPDNIVLAMTVSGFIPPSEASTTYFDPNVLYQWKIDNNGDAVEDLVIQAYVTGPGGHQEMHFRVVDPVKHRGGQEEKEEDELKIPTVRVTTGLTPIIATHHGIKAFAGVRDDPFFFDLVQFKKIIAGQATSFRNPGIDSFAGTDVLAIAVELPSALLGGKKLGVWGTTSRRQS
jgi:hypothetical protein